MIGLLEIVIGFVAVVVGFYFYNSSKQSFWKKRNIEGPEPNLIFGNFLGVILARISLHELLRDVYLTWKHKPFVGLYKGTNPCLFLNEPELIRHILIKDFTSFDDRGLTINEDIDPLSANLFMVEHHRWRGLRNKLSPIFTSGKLKQMYHLLTECAEHFEKYIGEQLTKSETIEVKEATAKFTTDVIGSCAFGLNLNSLGDEGGKFRKMGRRIFLPSRIVMTNIWLGELMPAVFKLLKLRRFPKKESDFFMNSIAETVAHRKKNGTVRPDFIHLMTQIRENSDKADFEITDELLAAQAFAFFLAGFETSSSTMSFALFELAQNKGIQDKLRAEIRDSLRKHDGSTPYEVVKDLKYLHKVFQETLRKYPAVSFIMRKAVRNYTLPGSTVEIPADTRVFISILGLHHDPKYYPKPEVFDPERFSEEAIQQRPQTVYLPFGEGPRNCIGARFANYQTKIGVIKIIKDYEVTLSPKMKIPFQLDRTSPVMSPVDGIHLDFKKIPWNISSE